MATIAEITELITDIAQMIDAHTKVYNESYLQSYPVFYDNIHLILLYFSKLNLISSYLLSMFFKFINTLRCIDVDD